MESFPEGWGAFDGFAGVEALEGEGFEFVQRQLIGGKVVGSDESFDVLRDGKAFSFGLLADLFFQAVVDGDGHARSLGFILRRVETFQYLPSIRGAPAYSQAGRAVAHSSGCGPRAARGRCRSAVVHSPVRGGTRKESGRRIPFLSWLPELNYLGAF